ncbi:hypothetical protein TCAL_03932 [Tigriopus californicus]|uniref:Peptidase M15A C-terminal domain-containing protein n=1 Tax=Tigriopus californicus TaxID=6832 RepID=A0A553P2P1_TIGCA|nr:uncharacterized protein LOC131883378 [Tigriopus californicus]TRY71949.1 hypothetical protein TCAL_03932 [Tigriopus californicus]
MSPTFIFPTLFLLASLAACQLQPPFLGASQPCYETEQDGVQGWCEHKGCCAGGNFVSGLCPNYPDQVGCCYSSNECGAECTETCTDDGHQDLACELLAKYEAGQLFLKPDHFSPNGNDPYDGASPLSEIRDTCYGRQAKRSAYGTAPGGCVCLQKALLQTMLDYSTQYFDTTGLALQINSMAGSSHSSSNSWHYEGNTMDVACSTPLYHCDEVLDFCRSRDAIELCFPGSSCGSHETWVHCAMPMDEGA